MKLAGFLSAMLAIPALAQAPQYGTRIGQTPQTVYLVDVPVPPRPELPFAGPARIGDPPEAGRVTGPAATTAKAEFETWVEQRSKDYAESVVTGFTNVDRESGKATIHRYVRDNFRNLYLTYTLSFESIGKTDTFRVTFADSTIPYPAPQILRDGETIALTLSTDDRTGRRMVDYIRVGTGNMPLRRGVVRDVYAEDAQLTIAKPRLRTNGVEQPAGNLPASLSAPIVWVDIPGQGRFWLSFKPRAAEGYTRAGEVAENLMVFSFAGNIFRIDCADRIASGSGTYNIYARRDLNVDPASVTRFAAGA